MEEIHAVSVLNSEFIKDEKYLALIEEIDATVVEADYAARYIRAQYWHSAGGAIRQFVEDNDTGPTQLVKEISKDIKKSEKYLWDSYSINKLYPVWEDLEKAYNGGKSISWTGIRKKFLGCKDKTDPEPDLAKQARGLIKRFGPENARRIAQMVLDTPQEPQNSF